MDSAKKTVQGLFVKIINGGTSNNKMTDSE